MNVYRQEEQEQRADLIPMAIAAVVAAVGIVALVWLDFDPGSDLPSADDGMTTASAVSRAGAIATPSEPPIHLQKPQTVPAIALRR
jgi:hypothetical protein